MPATRRRGTPYTGWWEWAPPSGHCYVSQVNKCKRGNTYTWKQAPTLRPHGKADQVVGDRAKWVATPSGRARIITAACAAGRCARACCGKDEAAEEPTGDESRSPHDARGKDEAMERPAGGKPSNSGGACGKDEESVEDASNNSHDVCGKDEPMEKPIEDPSNSHDVCGEDEAMEKSIETKSSHTPEENTSTVPPTLETPPLACLERGAQELYGWWRNSWWCNRNRDKVLGHMKEAMEALAQQCLRAAPSPQSTTLRVLSLSDGGVCEKHNMVPTSVLLAHALASVGVDALPPGVERVKIVGGDAGNPGRDASSQTRYCWPPWLELEHVCLDNKDDLQPQLARLGRDGQPPKFDVVLMRQGLCYCSDHSFKCTPPKKLRVTGVRARDASYAPSGTYILEPHFREGRPSYRKGHFLLHWRPESGHWGGDWIVREDNAGRFIVANAIKDCGSPALAQVPWHVWNGEDYEQNYGACCEVLDTSPPWRRPPCDCKCCGGIPLNAAAMEGFMRRVAAVLDERQPKAFALLHSGYYTGTEDEVKELQLEAESAAELFNSTSPRILATVLKRDYREDWPANYWNRIDGLLLSPSPA